MRNVGGARRGLNLWLAQRASAVLMALMLPVFLVGAVLAFPLDYDTWWRLFLPLPMKLAVLLFAAALLTHAWIGLREILIDYVHPMALRLPLYFVFAVLYLACFIWTGDILWSIK